MLTASSSGSSASFIVPNATFIVELAIFLVVLGLAAKFILPSLHRVRDERAGILRGGVSVSEAARAEAARLESERIAVLDRARASARALLEEASKSVDELVEDARARGRVEHDRRVVAAAARTEEERQHLHAAVMEGAVGLVVTAAERIVGEGFDASRHRDLIAAELADVDASTSGG